MNTKTINQIIQTFLEVQLLNGRNREEIGKTKLKYDDLIELCTKDFYWDSKAIKTFF